MDLVLILIFARNDWISDNQPESTQFPNYFLNTENLTKHLFPVISPTVIWLLQFSLSYSLFTETQ